MKQTVEMDGTIASEQDGSIALASCIMRTALPLQRPQTDRQRDLGKRAACASEMEM
jgi:hypothetical protein